MIYTIQHSDTNFNNFRVEKDFNNACRFYPNRYLISSKDRNKLQKIYNGNKVEITYPILHQNIPGKCGNDRVGHIITDILSSYRPLVLVLSEVRGDVVQQHTPHGYTFVPGTLKHRKNPRVSMLIRDTVTYKVEELKLKVPTVCVKIDDWRIIGYYREWNRDGIPDTDAIPDQLERLEDLVSCMQKKKKQGKTLALGDMNVDLYDISEHQKKLEDLRALIEDQLIAGSWLQMIKDHTRTMKDQRPSCIDHVYITHYTYVDYVENKNVSATDHNLIGVNLKFGSPVFIPQTFKHRNIDGIPEGKYEAEFLRGKISEVYKCNDPDLCLDILEFKILRPLNRLAPEKTITTSQKFAPWMTPDLCKKARIRNKMRRDALKSGDSAAWAEFKEYQRNLNKEKTAAKTCYYAADLQEGDSKQRWAKVQRLSKYKSRKKGGTAAGAMEIVDEDGKKITDSGTLADFMNKYFKSKVSKLKAELDPDPIEASKYTEDYLQDKQVPKDKVFKPVTKKQVKKIIRGLKNTSSVGRDGISTKVLKRYRHVIGPPLTHLINLCLRKKVYPSGWKIGLIRPLPKGGDLTVAKNWRPIVLNPILSKVFEVCVNSQLMSHMENHSLYSRSQHAYRHARSVSSALQDLNSIQADLRNRGKTVCILTTDVSAGFNLVSKEILIPKLSLLGLDSSACDLLQNYLTGRKTKTIIENSISEEITLDTGVGEGSVLGPNCFSINMVCISEVAKRTERRMKDEHNIVIEAFTDEFADDATGIIGANSEQDLQIAINIMLEEFLEYYSKNGLKLNVSKCAILIHRVRPATMTLCCGPIKKENKERDCLRLLGLWVDKDLTYEVHCGKVVGACYEKLGALTRLVNYLPMHDMAQLVEALILSAIEWCAELWLRNKKNQVKVQRLINASMRMILKKTLKDRPRVDDMLSQCGFLNATNMARRAMCCSLRRIIYNGVAPFSRDLTICKDTEGLYEFRQNRAIRCNWKVQTRFVRQSYFMESLRLYNGLGVASKFYEDEKDFRLQIGEKLKETFGNFNL